MRVHPFSSASGGHRCGSGPPRWSAFPRSSIHVQLNPVPHPSALSTAHCFSFPHFTPYPLLSTPYSLHPQSNTRVTVPKQKPYVLRHVRQNIATLSSRASFHHSSFTTLYLLTYSPSL